MTLFLVLGVNIYKSLSLAGELSNRAFPLKYQIVISVLGTMTVLMVIFYARYPYLDRRDSWFGKAAKRFDVNLKAKVIGQGEGHGSIRSLSVMGARLDWTGALPLSELQEVQVFITGAPVPEFKARVVACSSEVLRLKFLDVSNENKKILIEWLEKEANKQERHAS
jgi:hypothetical protein